MSEPLDNKLLDEYLGRNSTVSKQYRELAKDEVPAELDRLVLEKARDAVAPVRKSPRWTRWSGPLAIAASAVLIVSIVIESGGPGVHVDLTSFEAPQAPESTTRSDAIEAKQAIEAVAPTTAPAAAPAESPSRLIIEAPPATSEPQASVTQPLRESEHRQRAVMPEQAKRIALPDAPSTAPSTAQSAESVSNATTVEPPSSQAIDSAAPAAAYSRVESQRAVQSRSEVASPDNDLSEVHVTANRRKQREGSGAGPRGTIPPADPQSSADKAAEQASLRAQPERWLEYIRELRHDGKQRAADREWREFATQYPHYSVAESDAARSAR